MRHPVQGHPLEHARQAQAMISPWKWVMQMRVTWLAVTPAKIICRW